MGQELIYVSKLHTIQLNYLYTATSEAIFPSFRGGAVYGCVQAVSRSEKGTRISFLGKNWLGRGYIGITMSGSGEQVDSTKSVLDDEPLFIGWDLSSEEGMIR